MKVVALGELLIDFLNTGTSDSGSRIFEQNPGGAPANVACGIARLGGGSAFIGKVGRDMHGEFLKETLMKEKVDVSGLVEDPDVFTTLAFVKRDGAERSFSFARKPGADTSLDKSELDAELIRSADVFHFGSLSLTDEPARSATFAAIEEAKKAGALISYDPNYRAPLWKSEEAAVSGMREPLDLVDIIKISNEETFLLTGIEDPDGAAEKLLKGNISLVCVTLGEHGALVANEKGKVSIPGRKVKAADTTGAGDSFWAAFLFKLVLSGKKPCELSADELYAFGNFACAAASLTVQKRGAICALPTLDEVNKVL